ncbi:MAG: DUF11 domain-containing protein [Planctomycetaceae bacterium]|nr:DUF11 domain-containing protein [Planctomycetaceae bacterium]
MLRSALATAVISTTLLSVSLATGQDSESSPTLGQRFDRFRKNLFGGEKDETVVAAPQARAGARPQSSSNRRPNPNAPRSRESSSITDRTASNRQPGSSSPNGAPRSSRRTQQPGYQPAEYQPAPPSVPAEEQYDNAELAKSFEQRSDAPPAPKVASAPARRPAESNEQPADTFEPTLEDRTPRTASATKVGRAGPQRSIQDQLPAASAEVANESSVESETAVVETRPATQPAGARSAPRTLEERLAAARRQQKPKTIHPATAPEAAKPSAAAATMAAVAAEEPRVANSAETKPATATKPAVATRPRSPRPTDESDEQLTAHAVKSETPVVEELAAEADPVAEEVAEVAEAKTAPVQRVARAEKPAPQAAARKPARESTATSAPGGAVLFKQQSPILSVETSGPRKIKIGSPAPYNVTMQNTGTVAARDVVVSVKLPEWAEVAASTPGVGTARTVALDGASVLQWTIPALDAKSRAELSLSVVPRKSRPFDLAVTWTHTPESSQAAVEVQEPKLMMTLAGPDEIYFGEREVYKLTLSNPGTGDAENVVVRLLPTSPGDEQSVSHPIGNIAAGDSKVVELELTAKQANSLEIKAEAVADGDLHASIDEVIVVRRAELAVTVQGPRRQYAGTPATFKVHVTNPGNAAAKNVQVAALLPRGASYLSSSDGGTVDSDQRKVTWSIGNLRAGAEATMAFKCLLNSPGANTAQVACHAEGEVRNQGAATTDVEALADLTLKIIDPQGPVPVGQDITYEVHVTNRGSKAAEEVEIMAFFSPGIEPVAVDQGHHEISAGQIAFAPVARIEAGQELVYRIRARADRAANHVFRAEVMCPTLETKLSADETTRFYVDDSLEPDEAAAGAGSEPVEPAQLEPEVEAEMEPADEAGELPVETEVEPSEEPAGEAEEFEEPQPE